MISALICRHCKTDNYLRIEYENGNEFCRCRKCWRKIRFTDVASFQCSDWENENFHADNSGDYGYLIKVVEKKARARIADKNKYNSYTLTNWFEPEIIDMRLGNL